MKYSVTAQRRDSHGGTARCKEAEITLDTDVAGRLDAFNPAELSAQRSCGLEARAVPYRVRMGGRRAPAA